MQKDSNFIAIEIKEDTSKQQDKASPLFATIVNSKSMTFEKPWSVTFGFQSHGTCK